ncbi:MAG: hypothetical protein L0216_06210 [Planctomycetales bacterium]|nr:hypothetical protein [Planctomycetales bacterium]
MGDGRPARGLLLVLAAAAGVGLAVALLGRQAPDARLTASNPQGLDLAGLREPDEKSALTRNASIAARGDGRPAGTPRPGPPAEESGDLPAEFTVGRSDPSPPADLAPRPGHAGPTRAVLWDGAGTPLPFASISLEEARDLGMARTYQTNGRGRLGIGAGEWLWPGRYRATVWDQTQESRFAEFEVEVPPDPERDFEIIVPGDPRVSFVRGILLRNGKPWGGAWITDGHRPSAWCESAKDGTFALPTMPVDEVLLLVAPRPGAGWVLQKRVAVGSGGEPLRIGVSLAAVRGRVSSPAGSLPDLAIVRARRLEAGATPPRELWPEPSFSAFTDEVPLSADGAFEFTAIPPGTLVFGLGGQGIEVPLGQLDLAAGDERSEIAWTAAPAWRVRGRVLDRAGEPLAGVTLEPARARIAEDSLSVTGPFGRFDLRLWARDDFLGLRMEGTALEMVRLDWPESGEIERDLRLP